MRIEPHSHHPRQVAFWFLFLAIALPLYRSSAHEALSTSFEVISTLEASAGVLQSSGSTELWGVVGQPGSISTSPASGIVARQGAMSMAVAPTTFAVDAASPEIDEAGAAVEEATRTQLLGSIVNDDDSRDALSPSSVNWLIVGDNSPLASISANGVAQAAAVYQNTVAEFSGTYGGLTATNFLLVRNVLLDNYGPMAGNGFDDAWEVAKGIDSYLDPEQITNGQPNWFYYALNINPLAPLSSVAHFGHDEYGYLTITFSRNLSAADYSFVVEEASTLTTGFSPLNDPVIEAQTSSDGASETITTRASTPMRGKKSQFLRIRVERPSDPSP